MANAKSGGRPRYRAGLFTRFILILGVLAYSLLPLLASWPAVHARRLTFQDWGVIAGLVVFLQIALQFAVKRCGYKGLSFWEGVSLVAGCMRTGSAYTDMLIGGLSVFCFLIAAVLVALTPKPQIWFYRLVRMFFNNRLRQ
jgi:hypothetical protein